MEKYSVLFDMDGVIVDSEPVILKAAIRGLEEYGVHAKPEDFVPFIGAGEDRYIGGVANKYGLAYHTDIKKRVYDIYDEIVSDNIKIMPGIKDILAILKRERYSVALASSADLRKIKANLIAVGIEMQIFDSIVSGEAVVNKKPSPDIYLKAAEQLNKTPDRCIVIEDAVNGIEAAKAAGMKCIAVETSFTKEKLLTAGPDYVFMDMEEVLYNLERVLTEPEVV